VFRGSVFDSFETVDAVCACAGKAALIMMQEHTKNDSNPNFAIVGLT